MQIVAARIGGRLSPAREMLICGQRHAAAHHATMLDRAAGKIVIRAF